MRVLIGVLVLSACAWRTHDRVQDWRSDEALFAAAVAVTPDWPRPRLNYGYALGRAGRPDPAFTQTVTALDQASRRGDLWLMERARRQLAWLDVLYGVCEPQAARLYCSPQ